MTTALVPYTETPQFVGLRIQLAGHFQSVGTVAMKNGIATHLLNGGRSGIRTIAEGVALFALGRVLSGPSPLRKTTKQP
jgi:hypothetical protein